jgi:two-component system cell cycle sensor histidine kinase/response regulator CckA
MAASSPKPAKTILVVDDDPEVLALAADILRAAGYAVLSTGDPREALHLARTRAEPLHLLLTDVRMPLLGGRKLAEEFRSIRPDVKVLFMSGYWESLEAYEVRLAPGEPFLDKPFTDPELERAVRAALDYTPPVPRPHAQ